MSDYSVKDHIAYKMGFKAGQETQAAVRIAELEAALRDVLPYVDTCNSSHREAQAKGYAALEGGK
jgi:ABC-type Fe2+-enterobactin transport system substrate-binding protein